MVDADQMQGSASTTFLGEGVSAGWLHVVTHMDPRFGGLSAAVPNLATALTRVTDEPTSIAAFCSPGELYAPPSSPRVRFSEWPASRKAWASNPTLSQRFRESVEHADGLHIHGLWEKSTALAAHTARVARKPYVVSAHGMLEPWALRHKRLKKWVYSLLVERNNLQRAACVHALTQAEAEHYRSYGVRGPIAVIPNGVQLPARRATDVFLAQNSSLQGKRIVLFLGRIHPKKGLDLLLRAWPAVVRRSPEAHLVLAGPDFEGTKARLVALVEELGLSESVLFPGMLRDELKWSALAASEIFVLPSFSEGLAISVLEAMGVGLPVILSENCHMPEVQHLGAGWVIPAEIMPLQSALETALAQTPAYNRALGEKGRAFVQSRYSWPRVAEQMAEVYSWLKGGPQPETVQTREGRGQ